MIVYYLVIMRNNLCVLYYFRDFPSSYSGSFLMKALFLKKKIIIMLRSTRSFISAVKKGFYFPSLNS